MARDTSQGRGTRRSRRFGAWLLGLLALAGGCQGGVTLQGEGSTFVEPLMRVWTTYYAEATDQRVVVNYQANGSGSGITQMTKGLADFGCTDGPMGRKQLAEAEARGGPVLHVPLVAGAVVPIYNLPPGGEGEPDGPLHFTGEVLAEIFLGRLTQWNDPALAALNPGRALPDLAVQPVARADPSGTSLVFADYLAKVHPEARATLGVSNLPNWPRGVGIAQAKSDGVAGYVGRTPGAIGYVELAFALENPDVRFGTVRNRAGRDIAAGRGSIAAAAEVRLDARPTEEPYSLHELTYNLTDAAGPDAYPIVGLSFAVLYRRQPGPRGAAVRDFLAWAVSADGQKLAGKRHYGPLPEALRQATLSQLQQIETAP